jgi:hypothetical protein
MSAIDSLLVSSEPPVPLQWHCQVGCLCSERSGWVKLAG